MPKTKRTPINYKSQFGGEIFRPKEIVESDLATLEHKEVKPAEYKSKSASPMSNRVASQQVSYQDSNLASKQASSLPSNSAEVIERIRKVVKVPGKEVLFVRLTPEEKAQLGDIVYTYKRQGKKTSENEINRIAVNCILEDYRTHGKTSILARVIDALLA
jgi:hypothetical protein